MKVIAIDPGYDRCGIAILEIVDNKEVVVFSECSMTNKSESLSQRIFAVGQRINELIVEYQPQAMAIEELFFSKNTKTAMDVSQARGVIAFVGSTHGLPIHEFTPNQIKVAVTGYGSAKKEDVYFMVNKLIVLKEGTNQDDEIDAIAVGLTFLAQKQLHS